MQEGKYMVTALIFAGGTGIRMNSRSKPKQFLELHGKPIIIHTIEYFERHKEVDNIAVVCIESWFETLQEQLRRNCITKVKWITKGGKTGQESIYNGLKAIYKDCEKPEETIVLIHDGVRPLISDSLITENIKAVRQYGAAITTTVFGETAVFVNGQNEISSIADRNQIKIAKAPQSFYLNTVMEVHNQARRDEITNAIDSASLMMHYGHTLHIIDGPAENIKITSPVDFYVFRALYEARENSQIFGI